ncbi:MAG: NAD-dependent epimerase/dehydratase family protein [Candidatus Aenigmarchaeota archaeon]|nr:NAD-dependent epimerase/dehydratase family protein [Candidatus Aenigmarchaeota archaeon]
MKILVTGGAGFVGSNLADRLLKDGHSVNILDSMTTGRKENINARAKFFKGDIRDEDDIMSAISGCGAVFHLAAQTDARAADEDSSYKINYLGAKNVFDAAKDSNAKIIFTSSAAVYGERQAACKESDKCEPVGDYGKNKLRAEKAAGGNAFIARMFNVYGPRGGGAVNIFCGRIPEYKEIRVFGNGLQTRDFVHVDDAVNALLIGLEKSGVYNVGTGVETSILNLIDMIFAMTRNKPNARHEQEKKEIKRSKADITKIKALGWEPKVAIKDGIKSLLKSKGARLANDI